MHKNITLTNFKLINIYAVDLGFITTHDSELLNNSRGIPDWTKLFVEPLLTNSEFNNSFEIEYEKSKYAQTDKAERNTFSSFYQETMMPLIIRAKLPTQENITPFSFEISEIRIGFHGGMSIRSITIPENDISNVELSVDDFIKAYYNLKLQAKTSLVKFLNNFISIWNNCKNIITLRQIDTNTFEYFHVFEVFDFDFNIRGKQAGIATLFQKKNIHILKQVARLLRMTKSDYLKYNPDKLLDINAMNLGFRDDELWIINDERLVRHHPDDNVYLTSFLDDFILGLDILKQYEANLHFLHHWVIRRRAQIRSQLSSPSNDSAKDLSKSWFEIIHFYDNTLEQFTKQRNVRHSFFNLLLNSAVQEIKLVTYSKEVKNEFSELFSTLNSLTSFRLTETMLDLEKNNYALAKTGNKINNTLLILSIIMAIVSIIQLAQIILPQRSTPPKVNQHEIVDSTKIGNQKNNSLDSIKITNGQEKDEK